MIPESDIKYLQRCILSKNPKENPNNIYSLFGMYSFDKEHQLLLTIQYLSIHGQYGANNTITITKKEIEKYGIGLTTMGKRCCERIEYLNIIGQMDKLWI